ncbi:LysR family transcriptional regulator [Undibacterium sp. Jales W-56]|uniref:LysR family transcriptional regulator n=1 Tax=Undibacterium sp. Jales W-56 TaxID=2897325 RepID=UPI0021D1D9FB|nr:LysR family transcriptional regulator [Undibacterium sp. Jales W-56]MCU6435143.1 LysR family transcriptional regulator [Undibacterium sp. Jales W-56]
MRLTLRQLQIFLAVAHSGSTSAAADSVNLSQSATSAALNELEHGLESSLFDRVGKRLQLNDNGRLLLPQASQLLDAAHVIEQQFSPGFASSGAGLRIGASTTIGIYLLPAILAKTNPHSRTYPNVTIANTADIAQAVANFELDLGLIEGPCHQEELHVERWISDELIIVCSPQHPILSGQSGEKTSLKILRNARWLLREPGSGTRETVEQALLPHLHHLNCIGEFGNSEAIKYAAAEGLGLACLSRRVVADLLSMRKLVEVNTTLPKLERNFYLIHHKHKMLSARLLGFLDLCRGISVPGKTISKNKAQ